MSEAKHTPWIAEEPYNDAFMPEAQKIMRCDIVDAAGHLIAKRVPVEVAPLVIAAPLLLEACKAALNVLRNCEVRSGVCGCGESIEGHPVYTDHAAIDMAVTVALDAERMLEAAIAAAEGTDHA